MKLSDELFREIRNTLRLGADDATAAPARAHSNRRDDRLHASLKQVPIEPFGTNRRHPIMLVDIGMRGVSFLDSRAWGAGDKAIMYLPRSMDHVIPLLCMVRNSRLVDGMFRVGAEFVHEHEAPSTVISAVQRTSEAASDESAGRRGRRSYLPRAATFAQMHTFEDEQAGPILEAEVVDLSEQGVGLISAQRLATGEKLVVRLCPPKGKTITRMGEVVSCRPLDAGGFRVGMRFTEYKGKASPLKKALFGWLRNNDGDDA